MKKHLETPLENTRAYHLLNIEANTIEKKIDFNEKKTSL